MNLRYDQIVGHEQAISVLTSAAATGRVAHAYLFAGADGIGKRTTALAFAAALNCQQQGESACEECISCRKIASGNHPDLAIVERDGAFIKIDQVRLIGRMAQSRPYEGKYRVFLILDAHWLNPAAANALLKTLEEPGTNMVLILISANPQQLLPTVLSRCHRLNFNPLSPEKIEKILLDQQKYEPETARLLARLSGGSLGWVYQADLETIVEHRRDLLQALAVLDGTDEVAVTAFADRLLDAGPGLDSVCEMIKIFLRDAAVLSRSGHADNVVNIDIVESIGEFAARFSPMRLLAMGRSVGYAQRLLIRNVNKNLVALSLALELAHPTGTGMDTERMPR